LAHIYRQQGAYARAGDYYSRALALYRQVGDTFEVAQCLRGLAALARIGRDYDRAITLLEQVQTLLEEAGSQLWAASIEVFDLVELYLQQGRLDDMFALLANRRRYFEQVGDHQILLLTLHWQSIFQSRYGVLAEAIAIRRRHLALTQELARPDDAAWSLWELAELHRLAGDLAEARSLLRQAESQFSPALLLAPAFIHRLEAELALAAGDYAPAQALFRMAHDVAVAQVHGWSEAYALDGLGQAALGLGNWPEAEAHFRAAIRLAMDLGNRDLAMCSLVGLARLALARGEAAEAVYLAAFAAGHYLTWRDIKAQAAAVLAQALARLDVAEGTRVRQAGEAASLEAVLARAGAAGE
jgi:tetratricopeptide (TPR) repeat protein